MHRGRSARLAVVAAGVLAFVAAPSLASAATVTYRGQVTDAAHDSKSTAAGLDIVQVRAQYKTDGSVVFTLVTRGKIDGAKHDAVFAVFLGTGTCSTVFMGGGGELAQPTTGAVFTATSITKIGKQRAATGTLKGSTYQVRAKYAAFAGKTPGCFSAALVNPKKNNAVIDDVPLTAMSS